MSGGTSLALMTAEAEMLQLNEASPPYRIRLLGDPILTTPCEKVASRADIPVGLLDAMRRICGAWRFGLRPGLGISANQVGSLAAVCLVAKDGKGGDFYEMINPRITARSAELSWKLEGCLSIPNFHTSKKRHNRVTVTYLDPMWCEQTLQANGLTAQVIEHEIDHLAGVLITEGLSRQQRRNAERTVAAAVAHG